MTFAPIESFSVAREAAGLKANSCLRHDSTEFELVYWRPTGAERPETFAGRPFLATFLGEQKSAGAWGGAPYIK